MIGLQFKPFQMKDLAFRVPKLPDDVLIKKMRLKFQGFSKEQQIKKLKVEKMKRQRV